LTGIQVFEGFGHVCLEVALALSPLTAYFIIFQLCFMRLPKRKVVNILAGLVLTFIGLSLFLQGVYVGFLPVGQVMGAELGSLNRNWILIPIGFVIGLVTTLAEPTVRTMNYEVEKVSRGYIPQKLMLYTLSIGVAVSIAISMGRIIYGIPLWWFILPGYLISFALMRHSSPPFIAIAFDSGSVATGPMTVTFVLAITVGTASAMEGRDPLLEGFGMVTLVALSSILSVLVLGVLYGKKEREKNRELTYPPKR
jgi:hypothetical protein